MASTTTTIIEPPSLGAVSVSGSRVLWVDLARCLGLWLMVVGHHAFFPESWDVIYRVIWTFHMPMFFILAGALFRPVGIKARVKKDFWRLALPAWVCATVAVILAYGKGWTPGGTVGHTLASYCMTYGFCTGQYCDVGTLINGGWFVGALILTHLGMEALCRMKRWAIILVGVLAVICARYIGVHVECYMLRILPIGNGLMAMGFVVLGYLLREWLMGEKTPRQLATWVLLGAIAVAATVAFNGEKTDTANVAFGTSVVLCYVGAIGGSLMMFALARMMERWTAFPTGVISVVRDIAVGGVVLLTLDGVFFELFLFLFPNAIETLGEVLATNLGAIFAMAVLLLVVRLGRRYAPWLLGLPAMRG